MGINENLRHRVTLLGPTPLDFLKKARLTRNIALCFTQRLVCQHLALQVPPNRNLKSGAATKSGVATLPITASIPFGMGLALAACKSI